MTVLLCQLLAPLPAKAKKLDSLKAVLIEYPHNDDTFNVNVLYNIAQAYLKTDDQDSVLYYAGLGYDIANRIHYDRGLEICMQLKATVFLYRTEFDEAIKMFGSAIAIAERIHDNSAQSAIHHNLGNLYVGKLQYDRAIEEFDKSIAISQRINDQKAIPLSLINKGSAYCDLGKYSEALNLYLSALRIQEKENDKAGMASCYSNISSLYLLIDDDTRAKEYAEKSLVIYEQLANKQGIISNLQNIALIHSNKKEYKKVIEVLSRALILADSTGDPYWQFMSRNNMAEAFLSLGEVDTAFRLFSSVRNAGEKFGDPTTLAMGESGVGRVLIHNGKVKEGINHLLVCFEIVQKVKIYNALTETSQQLSDAYAQVHDYQNALRYHRYCDAYTDTLNRQKNDKKIQQVQFDYQLEKKQNQIELLKKNEAIQQEKNKRQESITVGLLIGIVLFSVIIFLLYRSRKFEKRNNAMMLKQNNEIQQQSLRLQELNMFKDKTFSVLSHDLRGPLAALSATMLMMDQGAITFEEFIEIKPEIDNQLNSLNILLENLLKWSKSYILGDMAVVLGKTDISEIVRENIGILKETASKKDIKIVNNISDGFTALCDAGQIDIVLRNLISNALKFTKPGGEILVSAENKEMQAVIKIKDNGVGMAPDQVAKVFTPRNGGNTYGTNGEKGIGLGLLLCHEFIKANNGTIAVESEQGVGSTFTITLPA